MGKGKKQRSKENKQNKEAKEILKHLKKIEEYRELSRQQGFNDWERLPCMENFTMDSIKTQTLDK